MFIVCSALSFKFKFTRLFNAEIGSKVIKQSEELKAFYVNSIIVRGSNYQQKVVCLNLWNHNIITEFFYAQGDFCPSVDGEAAALDGVSPAITKIFLADVWFNFTFYILIELNYNLISVGKLTSLQPAL